MVRSGFFKIAKVNESYFVNDTRIGKTEETYLRFISNLFFSFLLQSMSGCKWVRDNLTKTTSYHKALLYKNIFQAEVVVATPIVQGNN